MYIVCIDMYIYIYHMLIYIDIGFLVKNLLANAGSTGLIPGSEDPLKKEMATHSSILVGKFHGQRTLVGYSSWGCKESDMT